MSAAPGPIAALAEFDEILGRVKAFHASRLPPMLGFAPGDLAERLTQRFAQLRQNDYVVARCRQTPLDLGGIRIDPASGSITLSASTALSLLSDFLARWIYTALSLLAAIRPRSSGRRGTLVFGIGPQDLFRGGDDAVFLAYCANGPIEPLRDASCLLVQIVTKPRLGASSKAVYARSPLHALARRAGFSPLKALVLALRHAAALAGVLLYCGRHPEILLLARDFSETGLAAELDGSDTIESVVYTNTNYSSQPLWMWAGAGRKLRTHMVWYSKNVRPFLRPGDPFFPLLPARRLMRADTMWIWMASFADYLSGIGIQSQMRVVGPILWYLPAAGAPRRPSTLQIAVFDVYPVSDDIARKLGMLDRYYNLANASKFLVDIVEAARDAATELGTPVRVALKHKRKTENIHDLRYRDFIEDLAARNDRLALLPFAASVYDVVADSALTISIPYSSPVYVASHLGKPSLFYDPTGELLPNFDAAPGVAFASGREALRTAVKRALHAGAVQSTESTPC